MHFFRRYSPHLVKLVDAVDKYLGILFPRTATGRFLPLSPAFDSLNYFDGFLYFIYISIDITSCNSASLLSANPMSFSPILD